RSISLSSVAVLSAREAIDDVIDRLQHSSLRQRIHYAGLLTGNVNTNSVCYIGLENLQREKQMRATHRFTSSDLEAFPDNDGKRYEIIDGELYVSRQPHFYHQRVCGRIFSMLEQASQHGEGEPVIAPGLTFADDDDVAPDVIWL